MNLRKKLCIDDVEKRFRRPLSHTPISREKRNTIQIVCSPFGWLTTKGDPPCEPPEYRTAPQGNNTFTY